MAWWGPPIATARRDHTRASSRWPRWASTWANNLAHVLAQRGQREEALIWARRAVAIGGPHQDIYRQTLQEIEGRQQP